MLAGLQSYASVKVTPSANTILTATNPLGVIPKYIHITCEHNSAPYSENGYLIEGWLTGEYGSFFGKNGSTGANSVTHSVLVNQTPAAVQTHYISADTISIYKGNGTVSGRWHTGTEYTVHCYA